MNFIENAKEDRMHPIITLTIYTGEKVWDGPCSLKDMIVEMPEEIAAVFQIINEISWR